MRDSSVSLNVLVTAVSEVPGKVIVATPVSHRVHHRVSERVRVERG